MAKLGKVSTGSLQDTNSINIPIDESICGMMFDISNTEGLFEQYPLADAYFGNKEVQVVHNIGEAIALGITENGILDGIPYYHIQQYYNYIGEDHELYLSFPEIANMGDDTPFETMIIESNFAVFQVGVWTKNTIINSNGTPTKIISNIHSQMVVINGNEKEPSLYPSGINVILNGHIDVSDYHDLPECVSFGYKNISILIGQDAADVTKEKGLMGFAMACLHLCYAEENIGHVAKFNINKDDVLAGVNLMLNENIIDIKDINDVQRSFLIEKGYVFPMTYDAVEGGWFFASESTMSDGDYCSISNNRLMHKFKRIVKRVLIPMMHSVVYLDNNVKYLTSASVTQITNALDEAIRTYMVNALGEDQLAGYNIDLDTYQKYIDNDQLNIEFQIATLQDSNDVLDFVEYYNMK